MKSTDQYRKLQHTEWTHPIILLSVNEVNEDKKVDVDLNLR